MFHDDPPIYIRDKSLKSLILLCPILKINYILKLTFAVLYLKTYFCFDLLLKSYFSVLYPTLKQSTLAVPFSLSLLLLLYPTHTVYISTSTLKVRYCELHEVSHRSRSEPVPCSLSNISTQPYCTHRERIKYIK